MLTGVGLLLSVAGTAWAADAHRSLLAARSLLDGAFGTVEGYLYSPLAAALTIPALVVPEGVAIVGWILVKVAILILGATLATRGLRPMDRLLVAAAVIAFLPVLYDLELGNVTIVLAATIAVVAWTPDRATAGIPLGIMLAATPKPQLIPVLIWMAVFRRRALVGALGAAGFGTLAAFAVFGLGPFERWTAALLAPPYLTQGNLSLSTLPPPRGDSRRGVDHCGHPFRHAEGTGPWARRSPRLWPPGVAVHDHVCGGRRAGRGARPCKSVTPRHAGNRAPRARGACCGVPAVGSELHAPRVERVTRPVAA